MPKPMTFSQFCTEHGLTGDAEVQGHIHAGLRCAPTTKTYSKFYESRLRELQSERSAALAQYQDAIARGEVREHTREETLAAAAAGHPDNRSTQAAQRVMARRAARKNGEL